MTKTPETPQVLLDTLKTAEKAKVKLTPEIEQEIREHLAEAQARAERGEPMTQEMAEFMENVRLWVEMPEGWREKLRTVKDMKNDDEWREIKKCHISVRQWLDLLRMAEAKEEKDEKGWIHENFQFPGEGKIRLVTNLDFRHLSNLKGLPEGLEVVEFLFLDNSTGLISLPEGLSVGMEMSLNGCTGLTGLPEGLKVGGSLFLNGCTGLTHLPEGLSVGNNLFLAENLSKQVKKDAEKLKKEGKIRGNIEYS